MTIWLTEVEDHFEQEYREMLHAEQEDFEKSDVTKHESFPLRHLIPYRASPDY